MKQKSNIIRIGDTVKIVNPIFVERIGYEFTHQQAVEEIKKTYKEEIAALMRLNKISEWMWERVENQIAKPLAYSLVRKRIKRGNERKIYTKTNEALKDYALKVVGKRNAKTGFYFPPEGGEDGEPGGINYEKTHVILELHTTFYTKEPVLIEQCNVVKL